LRGPFIVPVVLDHNSFPSNVTAAEPEVVGREGAVRVEEVPEVGFDVTVEAYAEPRVTTQVILEPPER
jgi:hypothetical protein